MIKTYLTTFYRSIFSPPLYADVIHRWKGTGVLYLLFLSFLIGLILCLRLSVTMFTVPQSEVDYVVNQIPEISINQGKVTTDIERPYDITLRTGQTVIRLVRDVDLDTVRSDNQNIPIIVTETDLIVVRDQTANRSDQLRVHSLENIETMEINRSIIQDLWVKAKWFIPVVVLPFVAIGLWIGYFIQMLVIALISYIVTAFMKEEFVFTTRMRMAAVAFTPVLLVNQLSELILHHKMNFMMMAAMATLYLFVMVKTSRQVA